MANTIKAVILDVDGVLVGENSKLNFPEPNSVVIDRLKSIKAKGIAISLCTSRPLYSVSGIIEKAGLDNLHIGLAGAIVFDPIDNVTLETHPIDKNKAQEITKIYLDKGIYTEIYTGANYYLQKNQRSDLTDKHAKILQKMPGLTDSLLDLIDKSEVLKILPVATTPQEKKTIDEIFEPFKKDLIMSWALHPSIPDHNWGNITAKGISKRRATAKIADSLGIKMDEILGVGDGISDWQFIELCGYGAAMGNGDAEIKKLVIGKNDRGYVGKSIEENGILDIFDHYGL